MPFEEYLKQRLQTLLRFATVVTCDPHLAEDIVQEVLARAHPRWDHISSLEDLEAYLKRMVVNEFLSWRRRSRRVVAIGPADLAAAAPAAPDHAPAHSERDDLMRRIAGLPARQRAVVALRYHDGCTDSEIAQILGCREVTVRAHASRALAALRSDLSTSGNPETEEPATGGETGMTDIDDIRAALRGFADRAPEPERVTSGLAGRMRAYRQRRVLLAAGAVAAGTVAVGVPGYLLLSPHGSRANLPSPPAEPSPGRGNPRARMYLRPTWLPDGVLEFSRQGRIGGSPYQLRTWGSPAFLAAARAGNTVVMDLTAVVSLQVDQPTPPVYSSPWPPESAPPTGPFNPLGEPPNTTVGRHPAVVSAGGGPLSLTWLLDGGVVARLYLRGTGGTPEGVLATARRIAESVVPDNTNGVEAGLHFGWLPDAVDTAVTSVDAFGVMDSWYQVVEITPGRGPGAWASLGSRPEASYLRGQTIAVRGRSGILSGNTVTVELDGDRWLQGRLVNLTDGGDYRVAVARLVEGIAIGPDAYRGWVGTR